MLKPAPSPLRARLAGYVALTKRPEEVHLQEEPLTPATPATPTPATTNPVPTPPRPTDTTPRADTTPRGTDTTPRGTDAEHARNGQVADRKV